MAGADEIYCFGGVQAVGAMALGTETIAHNRHDCWSR
ncbi:histidinol dehydrogenase [Vibrio lentus]|nr:histidinol dehydrogenase [Vibrio lentus]